MNYSACHNVMFTSSPLCKTQVAKGKYSNALWAALTNGRRPAVQFMLVNGASVNIGLHCDDDVSTEGAGGEARGREVKNEGRERERVDCERTYAQSILRVDCFPIIATHHAYAHTHTNTQTHTAKLQATTLCSTHQPQAVYSAAFAGRRFYSASRGQEWRHSCGLGTETQQP